MKTFLLCVMFACLVAVRIQAANTNEELEDAKLLVVKSILNNYIVEGLDLSIKYTIYNIGNSPASSVKLEDKNFPADKFEYLSGFDQVKWARIPASSNVSHTAVLKPKIVGPYNFTSAVVSYLPSDKNSKTQIGYSTDFGEIYIQRLKDYNRKFASHTIDWILFAIMASPSICLPYFLWYSSKKRYEKGDKSKSTKQQ